MRLPIFARAVIHLLILLFATCAFGLDTKAATTKESVIEGTLSQVSTLPRADVNPYPDCYYTAIVDIHQIVAGESIPKRIIIVLPGFFGRKYAPESGYKTGDKIRATVVPFATMPDRVRQTQQADEIEDVDLEFYFPQLISLVKTFHPVKSPIIFPSEMRNVTETKPSESTDHKARAARRKVMQQDLDLINAALTQHGGDWDSWHDSLEGFREEYKKKVDSKAELWVGDSFFSAGLNAYGKGYSQDFVQSIIAFKKYLEERNVDLILVRVPQKGEVVEDLFTSAPPNQISNPYLLKMYKELLEADVEIVTDIIPRLIDARQKFPLMYWYQQFQEEHPAEGAAWVIAETISERLSRYDKIKSRQKKTLRLKQVSLSEDTFKWPKGNPRFNPEEKVKFTSVWSDDYNPLLKQGSDSPVLVVGSSFIGSPSFELGGNIPAYLAYLTGVLPDVLYRSGSNATIPRTIAREGMDFLKNRVVCVFPFVPWAIHLPLDLPPIVNPATCEKILLSKYSGVALPKSLIFTAETPREVYKYSAEGDLTIQAKDKESRIGGEFRIELPEKIFEFSYFAIEILTTSKDAATIKAKYEQQVDNVHKSYSQSNAEEVFVFKPVHSHKHATFNISNLRIDTPITIKEIKVFGLSPRPNSGP